MQADISEPKLDKHAFHRKLFDRQEGLCIWCSYPMNLVRRKNGQGLRALFSAFEKFPVTGQVRPLPMPMLAQE